MNDLTRKRTLPATPVRALRVRVIGGPSQGIEGPADRDTVSIGSADHNDVVLADPAVSRFHLEVRRTGGALTVHDHGSTNGTRIGTVVLRSAEVVVDPGTTIDVGESRLVLEEADRYVVTGTGPEQFGDLIGTSAALRSVTSTLAKVAASDAPVLVQGESGTGKELAARAIHEGGARREGPLVVVDCGAIAPSLFASELFGHERGAFTGADRRHQGAFERASGGTLFLDEIGELGPELQAALLGALERKRVRRVGGTADVAIDVRVIAATHRDLRAAVNAGAFRLDLYYRLAAVRVTMPALRDRPEDVPLLVRRILEEQGRPEAFDVLFPAETLTAMKRHAWPGNVRELRNAVLGTLALGEPPELEPMSGETGKDAIEAVLDLDYGAAKRALLDHFERRWLARLLERTGGNVRAGSREGNIERKHLAELLKRHGLR